MSQTKKVLSQEKKKVKVAGIANAARQYPYNNATNYVHHVMFEGDNNKWEYHSTKDKIDKFKEGDVIEVEMKIEQRENNGNTYTDYKIRTIDDAGAKGKGGFKGEPKDEGVITMLSCIGHAATLHAEKGGSTSTKDEDVIKTAEKFYAAAIAKSTTQTQYKPAKL